MQVFQNKIALITGAGSGIGLALAKKAAALGMRLLLADINSKSLGEAKKNLESDNCEVFTFELDVSQENDLKKLAEYCLTHLGIPKLLINNAGVGGPIGPIWQVPLEQIRLTWHINVSSMVFALRAFMPYLLELKEEAHIVNTASMAGFYSAPYLSTYEISKHAVVALTESLYHDLKRTAPHIKVSLLCPGWVSTNIYNPSIETSLTPLDLNQLSEQDLKWVFNFVRHVKKGINPDEVAEKVFLAIKEEKFYIFTDSQMKEEVINHRLEAIISETEPASFEF